MRLTYKWETAEMGIQTHFLATFPPTEWDQSRCEAALPTPPVHLVKPKGRSSFVLFWLTNGTICPYLELYGRGLPDYITWPAKDLLSVDHPGISRPSQYRACLWACWRWWDGEKAICIPNFLTPSLRTFPLLPVCLISSNLFIRSERSIEKSIHPFPSHSIQSPAIPIQ